MFHNQNTKVCSPQKSVYRREAKDQSIRSDIDRLGKNRREKSRIAELVRRCGEYRMARISFEQYRAAVLSIVRKLSNQLLKMLTSKWGKPDTHEFASAFAV